MDVALIPIGGHYTMDRHDAVVAAELIGAGTVIPMHYNTFPPIETDAEAFKADVESKTELQGGRPRAGREPRPSRLRPFPAEWHLHRPRSDSGPLGAGRPPWPVKRGR